MSDLFKEQLALTIDENSPYEIQANLSSSVKENKVRASHYEIQMSVSKSEATRCALKRIQTIYGNALVVLIVLSFRT